MGSTIIDRQNDSIVYSAQVDGYNAQVTFWKTLSGGGDPTVVSNRLQINQDEICSLSYYKWLESEFIFNMPVAPTTGQDKKWGFSIPGLGDRARVEFEIAAAVFRVVAYDSDGVLIDSKVIPWNSNGETWNGNDTRFGLLLLPTGIIFKINGRMYAKFAMQGFTPKTNTSKNISNLPVRVHILNNNADNMGMVGTVLNNVALLS